MSSCSSSGKLALLRPQPKESKRGRDCSGEGAKQAEKHHGNIDRLRHRTGSRKKMTTKGSEVALPSVLWRASWFVSGRCDNAVRQGTGRTALRRQGEGRADDTTDTVFPNQANRLKQPDEPNSITSWLRTLGELGMSVVSREALCKRPYP